MSKMKKGWKLTLAIVAGTLIIGGAIARVPPVGQGWQEWTYYNASGQAIGGKLYDCDGITRTWGTSSGAADLEITNGPCP